jgi:ADP-heptose:LPS heptosyltransferase
MSKKPKRILLIRIRAIGDVLLCLPVARALRETFPGAWLAWLVEEPAHELLQGLPHLDEVIVWNGPLWRREIPRTGRLHYLWRQWEFIRSIRQRQFDTCIDLQGKVSTGLLAWFAGIPRRIAFADATLGIPPLLQQAGERPQGLGLRSRKVPGAVCTSGR